MLMIGRLLSAGLLVPWRCRRTDRSPSRPRQFL